MTMKAKKAEVKQVSELSIKRKITLAGRIQDRIAPDLRELDTLKKEIKAYEVDHAAVPWQEVLLVSGEYAALLTAEREEREISPDTNRALLGRVGLDTFLELVSPNLTALKKILSEQEMDAIMPKEYSGKGRRFSITKKT
jgi:hypothetical protein